MFNRRRTSGQRLSSWMPVRWWGSVADPLLRIERRRSRSLRARRGIVERTMTIRVMHVGLGPIGAAVARKIVARKGFQIVAAVDIDPHKMGKDVGDVIELG